MVSLVASQAYRGALLRLPRVSGRRRRSAPHHTAATYVRTHVYIGSDQPRVRLSQHTRPSRTYKVTAHIYIPSPSLAETVLKPCVLVDSRVCVY